MVGSAWSRLGRAVLPWAYLLQLRVGGWTCGEASVEIGAGTYGEVVYQVGWETLGPSNPSDPMESRVGYQA